MEEKRNVLRKQIKSFMEDRSSYLVLVDGNGPQAVPNIDSHHSNPEKIPLLLPSSLPSASRASSCLFGVMEIEQRLHVAQASDALAELRRQLRMTMGLWHYKITQVGPSQQAATHAWNLISQFEKKTSRCANRYRAVYTALLALDPEGDWRMNLRCLKPADIKGPGRGKDEAEGTQELSWIWLVERRNEGGSDKKDIDEGVYGVFLAFIF